MTTFLENPTEFSIHYDKYVHYSNGMFQSLRAGGTGYGSPELYNKTPNALSATIYCKNNNKELFYSLKESVKKLQSDDIKVHITEPKPIQKIISMKPEYEEKIKEIEKKNKEIDEKYNSLCDQLYELGCDRIEGWPNHIRIPMEYYNTVDEYYYNTPITIYCTNNTKLYEQLSNQ